MLIAKINQKLIEFSQNEQNLPAALYLNADPLSEKKRIPKWFFCWYFFICYQLYTA
jgi:hypothetical protein